MESSSRNTSDGCYTWINSTSHVISRGKYERETILHALINDYVFAALRATGRAAIPTERTLSMIAAPANHSKLCQRDTVCRQFAEHQNEYQSSNSHRRKSLQGGAAIGTAAGALAGAAIRAAADSPHGAGL